MSVSDYSPKRPSSQVQKTRKLSKWAQFVESIEILAKDNELSTDSQSESERKDHSFLDFLRKKETFERNAATTSSARYLPEPKVQKVTSKSLASSPSKIDQVKRTPILKCFELPKLPLTLGDKKRDKSSLQPTNIIEENLLRLMTALPKRRSSTPCTVKALTQKRISELRSSGAKTDSENDDFLKCEIRKKSAAEVICTTPDNIVITKTAPSVERFRRYSSSSTDDVCDVDTSVFGLVFFVAMEGSTFNRIFIELLHNLSFNSYYGEIIHSTKLNYLRVNTFYILVYFRILFKQNKLL